MSMAEYAKILRWNFGSPVYGLRTTITTPTDGHIGQNSGFINFYLGAYGSGTGYECGISANRPQLNDNNRWHWFWNTTVNQNDGGPYNIAGGSNVTIELSINPSTSLLEYKVNGTVVRTFAGGTGSFTTLTNARLIVAACDRSFTTVPNPLPAWGTEHLQVVCSNFSYRNASGNWVAMTSSNSTRPSTTEKWPNNNHVGVPQNYTIQFIGNNLYASLKP